MHIWILSLYICTSVISGQTKTTISQWDSGDGYYATEALCVAAGKESVARQPWLDDMMSTTHKTTNFRCNSVSVSQ